MRRCDLCDGDRRYVDAADLDDTGRELYAGMAS